MLRTKSYTTLLLRITQILCAPTQSCNDYTNLLLSFFKFSHLSFRNIYHFEYSPKAFLVEALSFSSPPFPSQL